MRNLKLISVSRRYSINNLMKRHLRLSSSISSSTHVHSSRNTSSAITNTTTTSDNSSTFSKYVTFVKPFSSSSPLFKNIKSPNLFSSSLSIFSRSIHAQPINDSDSLLEWVEDGGPMTIFLTRFSLIMKGKLFDAYPDIDKETTLAMLLIIISELEKGGLAQMLDSDFHLERALEEEEEEEEEEEVENDKENVEEKKVSIPRAEGKIKYSNIYGLDNKPSQNFSKGLWKTVWEVSTSVLEDIIDERINVAEERRNVEETSEARHIKKKTSEARLRINMLSEMIFKWRRGKMRKFELFQELQLLHAHQDQQQAQEEEEEEEEAGVETVDKENVNVEGKIKYHIYGIDLSDPRFAQVVDRIHEADKLIAPGEPKEITGKCKLVHEKILSLKTEDLPSSLLTEFTEILQPNRIDWLTLLDKIKQGNLGLYFKMAEHVLDEDSFQTNSRDYLKLMHAYTKDNRFDDAERILRKLTDKCWFIPPDIITFLILVQMYNKTNNVERAKASFDIIRRRDFLSGMKTNKWIIMTFVNVAQTIYTKMQLAHIQPNLKSCAFLVDVYGQDGDSEQARRYIDNMIRLGYRPDDRCTSSMLAAYENKNLLDKALHLYLELEVEGVLTGTSTYGFLIEWLGVLEHVVHKEYFRKVDEKEILL